MLSSMTVTKMRCPVPPKSAGSALRARRAYLGLKAEDVAHLTGGVINTRLLSRLENGHVNAQSLRLGKYQALLAALQWTPTEFEEVTGVKPATSGDLPGSEPYAPTLAIPIMGNVSAGLQAVLMESEHIEYLHLDPSLPGLRGRRAESFVALRVAGDSMVSERAGMSIKAGAHVIVEIGSVPNSGDTVVAWLPRRDIAVIKQYREEPAAILRSINPAGPAFRLADEPVEIRGVVRLIITYP